MGESTLNWADVNHRASPEGTPLKRVALACFAGSAIEYYDFLIYGTAAALVFPTVFFPNLSPTMATLASLGAFATAFLSRPIGAVLFGHFGDRLGRKKTLITTLLIMGLSTVAVGLLPGQATIGVAAPVILLMLRLLQGVAVGGEWAGSVLLSAEYAPAAKRGRYGMFTQLGVGAATVLAGLVFLAVDLTVGEHSSVFVSWGWRIPFLLSAVLIAIALYVRLNIDETPVFADYSARTAPARSPVMAVLAAQPGRIVLAAGSVVSTLVMSYVSTTYLVHYAHTQLGYSRTLVLATGVLAGLSVMAVTAGSSVISDRFGRRPVMLVGLGLALLWSLAIIPIVNLGHPVSYVLAIVINNGIIGVVYGPVAAFLPEIFVTAHRFTGTALAFNIAGVFGGALAPMLAGILVANFGSFALGLMMATFVVISLTATYLLPETQGTTLDSAQPATRSSGLRVPI